MSSPRAERGRREGRPYPRNADTLFAHEREHVLQNDFALQAWAAPAQRRLLARVPGGAVLDRYVDLGLHAVLWLGLNAIVSYDDRPWEREAYFLSERPPDRRPQDADGAIESC